jgi:hypothetical protein
MKDRRDVDRYNAVVKRVNTLCCDIYGQSSSLVGSSKSTYFKDMSKDELEEAITRLKDLEDRLTVVKYLIKHL